MKKVKIFTLRNNDDLNSDIQNWLKNNQGINILWVCQSPGRTALIITIFYEEDEKKMV